MTARSTPTLRPELINSLISLQLMMKSCPHHLDVECLEYTADAVFGMLKEEQLPLTSAPRFNNVTQVQYTKDLYGTRTATDWYTANAGPGSQ